MPVNLPIGSFMALHGGWNMNPAHAMIKEAVDGEERWELEHFDFDSQEVTEIDEHLDFEIEVTEPIAVSTKSPMGTPNPRHTTCFSFLFRVL